MIKWAIVDGRIRHSLLDSSGRVCSGGSLPPRRLREGRLADEVLGVTVEVAGVKAALLGGLATVVADTLLRLGSRTLLGLVGTEPVMS